MQFLIRFIINLIALYLILNWVPGFVNGQGMPHAIGWVTALIVAIVFGIINALLGPILRLISAPITFLTVGLFSIVVNWILFALTVWIVPGVKGNWSATLIGAIIMMIVSTLLHTLWKSDAQGAAV